MSSVKTKKQKQEEKIKKISFEFDRLFVLLKLQGAFSYKKYNDKFSYDISKDIR